MCRLSIAPDDAGVVGVLAVRTRADRKVIAESPVVEIVPATMTVSRKGRDLILLVAGIPKQRLATFLNAPRQAIVRQPRGRLAEELGVRLQR